MVKVGFVKMGNIGTSLAIDLLFDEIAEREDINTRTFSSGAKMGKEEADDTKHFKRWYPDLLIMVSPNPSAQGPAEARRIWKDVPTIIISDGPTKKDERQKLADAGFGYIILPVDPLIGAKREYLDTVEMVNFNAEVNKTLAFTGAIRLVQETIDGVIEEIEAGETLNLPHILAKPEKCIEYGGFSNSYAKAKALAALHILLKAAEINSKACFGMKGIEAITLTTAAGHEMVRTASMLADEAREIEKCNDTVSRKPHARDGKILSKTRLYEKPE
ncbi:MAG: F420-dependent methylenetetrahydromethanopterin dehydrogenase [Candidatus Argoarchaeum ethanivorans]|uniref:F420-dependent methylenetetrahydromethanopterin dehydrogenase n=1 Tax=Candidatus Argoarchaeum ethanivorans TaxID=2608793 RepID=A0A811T8Y6_9EURY|nr:MAG: F420-dependent methylenetetrahydromethanopterin dehydrogenase [Candidatus Argoarchaeum ethanivorans]